MGLHSARERKKGPALVGTNPRLAISGSWPSCGYNSDARRRWRLLQRDMGWLRWSPDSVRAGAFCRLHQPGPHVAANLAPLATTLRHCVERAADLGKPLYSARPSATRRIRELHDVRRGEASAGDETNRPSRNLHFGWLSSR